MSWEGPPPTKDSDPRHRPGRKVPLPSCPDPAPHACSTHSLTLSPDGGACCTPTPVTPSANVCLLSTCCRGRNTPTSLPQGADTGAGETVNKHK